ncbi:LOW QUALITY PROTEIN: maestro heat-like repeat-containing protein family member 1 [Mantella aurantiaca]
MANSSVKRLATTLMDTATDKDHVQEQVYSSLCFMGETGAGVGSCCDSYFRQNTKFSFTHRTIILRAMETIVQESLPTLTKDTAKMVIVLASNEMTKFKDIIFEWQQAASNVLVAVGKSFINNVMEELLLKFQPGVLPHFFIMQTLANLSVRRAMVQLISAMAHHGYLDQAGGEVLLEYIIRLCCISPDPSLRRRNSDQEEVTEESVRRISINTLYLISTTVHHMTNVLWPYLLEFVVPIQYSHALSPLCKSLVHLGQKKMEDNVETFLINYNVNVNLPSPFALFTRLLVVSTSLQPSDGRNEAALRLLSVLQIIIHPAIGGCWEQEVPGLLQCLEESEEKGLQQKDWEDKLLKLLSSSLRMVSDDGWTCQLSQEMRKQLNSYNGSPVEKNFLYKCIGTTLGACCNRDVVRKGLQDLLANAQYQEEAEREGLAVAFGICSSHHLDDTLEKLAEFLKSDTMKKNMGIFNIFKDRSDGDLEKMKSALILCYGYVSVYSPTELLLPRLDSDILRNIFLYFHTKFWG